VREGATSARRFGPSGSHDGSRASGRLADLGVAGVEITVDGVRVLVVAEGRPSITTGRAVCARGRAGPLLALRSGT
jgi:hypothetical protein